MERVLYNPLASKGGSESQIGYTALYIRSQTADSLCLVSPDHKDDAIASNQMQKPLLQQPDCSSKVKFIQVQTLHHTIRTLSNHELSISQFMAS